MSCLLDYGLDSPSRRLLLLVLFLEDKEKNREMDVLHIQKTIRYFEYLTQKEDVDFSNFHLGSVSYELDENIEALANCGLVDEIEHPEKQGSVFALTKEGERCAEVVKEKSDIAEMRKLIFAKQQFNDLHRDELLFFMYKLLPQSIENSIVYERLEKIKKELTRKLYVKGRINLNTAVKWSGLSEKEFLGYLSKDT